MQKKVENSKVDKSSELLLESIFEKWNPICCGCRGNGGIRDCPLCREYYRTGGDDGCVACPVRRKTGSPECKKTPYYRYGTKGFCTIIYAEAAEAMCEFLISLLPQNIQADLERYHLEWAKTKGGI